MAAYSAYSQTFEDSQDTPSPSEDVLASLKYDDLTKTNPHYEKWIYRWDDYRLMYRGGEEFMLSAGETARLVRANISSAAGGISASSSLLPGSMTRVPRRFLWQLEGEPNPAYLTRLERAFYVGYVGPIIDYFVHWLFSQPPILRPAVDPDGATVETPDWFGRFNRDCSGNGQKFADFLRDAFKEMLITRHTGILIGSAVDTAGMSQAEAESQGIDGPVLTPYLAHEILDWQKNEAGDLDWVVLRKVEHRRQFPSQRISYETIRYVDRSVIATWEARQSQKGEPGSKDVMFLGAKVHNAGVVPFVMPEVPEGLWVANKLGGWQLELFNQTNMLSRGELLSCFIQPILTSSDPGAQQRVFGDGTLLVLRSGDATGAGEEKFTWSSAATGPLEFLGGRLKEKRDEGYRIVHQMSLAVDGDSAQAVARSGLSKIEERRATEIVLNGFGGYMRDAAVKVLNIISKLFGEDVEWVCQGFDNFQVSSLEEELQTAGLLQTLQIKSRTFNETAQKKIARRVLDHEDEQKLIEIDKEIEAGFDAEEEEKLGTMGAAGDEQEITAVGAPDDGSGDAINIDGGAEDDADPVE